MLHMVLFLLKIIGILLGIILGLLLILILVVLLVPIRYRLWADNREDLQGRVRVTWLLRIISFQIAYANEKLSIKLKIFGKIFYDNHNPGKEKRGEKTKTRKAKLAKDENLRKQSLRKKRNTQNKKGRSPENKNTEHTNADRQTTVTDAGKDKIQAEMFGEAGDVSDRKPVIRPEDGKERDEKVVKQEIGQEIKQKEKQESIKRESTQELIKQELIEDLEDLTEEEKKEGFRFFRKVKEFFYKIKSFFQKIISGFQKVKERFVSIRESLSDLIKKWDMIKAFFGAEVNKQGIKASFYALKKIIKHALPGKIKGTLEFGTGDPCSTGQALGAAACFYGLYGKSIQIIPNFNEEILEGNIYVYGRIRIVTLLIIVVKLILNENFRGLIKNFRAFKEDL